VHFSEITLVIIPIGVGSYEIVVKAEGEDSPEIDFTGYMQFKYSAYYISTQKCFKIT